MIRIDVPAARRAGPRFRRGLAAALVTAAVLAPSSATADETAARSDRLIVKLRDSQAKALIGLSQRILRVGEDAGTKLRYLRPMAVGAHVVAIADGATPDEMEALARTLSTHPDVEYAVPDGRKRVFAAPNDPLYRSEEHTSELQSLS